MPWGSQCVEIYPEGELLSLCLCISQYLDFSMYVLVVVVALISNIHENLA